MIYVLYSGKSDKLNKIKKYLTSHLFVIIFVTDKEKLMNTSSKFVVATHIMTGLASRWTYFGQDYTSSSEHLAKSVNTNPVVIRRILGLLAKANLIISKSGPNGGSKLSKEPSQISLADIYNAVEKEEVIFHYHYKEPDEYCPIGGNIQDALSSILKPLTSVVVDYLANISLEEIMTDTMRRSGILKFLEMGYSPCEIEEKVLSGEIKINQ